MGDMSREPSMEEILSSIRRVIARDDSRRSAGLSPLTGDEPEDDFDAEDILELTHDAGAMPAPQPVQEEADMVTPERDALTAPEPAAPAVDSAGPLVSPVSEAASRQSLESLATMLAGGKPAEPAGSDAGAEMTVNALVEAALRPMLKQWLDAHLPATVERLVAREIARIAGNRL